MAEPLRAMLDSWAGFVIDLDGTLVHGRRPIAGAAQLLQLTGDRAVIVSNNSTHLAEGLAAELRAVGLEVPADRILLAGQAAVERLAADRPGVRVLLRASSAIRRHACSLGLVPVSSDDADVVLLARDQRFSYPALARIVSALRRGAALIVANPDLTHPGPGGATVPETGALLAAVMACLPAAVPRIIGKPEPHLFREAARRLDVETARILVIGDNPATDELGARRAGMGFLSADDALSAALGAAEPIAVPA